MPSTRSRSRIGMPRKSRITGWAFGHHSNLGSLRRSGSLTGAPSRSIAPSMPCCLGSGPIASHCLSVRPSATNSANEPSSSGTPSAA